MWPDSNQILQHSDHIPCGIKPLQHSKRSDLDKTYLKGLTLDTSSGMSSGSNLYNEVANMAYSVLSPTLVLLSISHRVGHDGDEHVQ